jgi:hypothetical protein
MDFKNTVYLVDKWHTVAEGWVWSGLPQDMWYAPNYIEINSDIPVAICMDWCKHLTH